MCSVLYLVRPTRGGAVEIHVGLHTGSKADFWFGPAGGALRQGWSTFRIAVPAHQESGAHEEIPMLLLATGPSEGRSCQNA